MENIGIELELAVLLVIAVVGTQIFAVFELETPAWRKVLKWTVIIAITLGLYPYIGHGAALVPLGLAVVGLSLHFVWCRRNGIHPVRATPRARYYELRGWDPPE